MWMGAASRMPNGERTRTSLAAKKGTKEGVQDTWKGEGAWEPGKELYGKRTFELNGPIEAKESNAASIVAGPEPEDNLAFRESVQGSHHLLAFVAMRRLQRSNPTRRN
jgi:hypothetical protein